MTMSSNLSARTLPSLKMWENRRLLLRVLRIPLQNQDWTWSKEIFSPAWKSWLPYLPSIPIKRLHYEHEGRQPNNSRQANLRLFRYKKDVSSSVSEVQDNPLDVVQTFKIFSISSRITLCKTGSGGYCHGIWVVLSVKIHIQPSFQIHDSARAPFLVHYDYPHMHDVARAHLKSNIDFGQKKIEYRLKAHTKKIHNFC